MDLKWWQELYRQTPVIALLMAILATGFWQYWVWGSTYLEMKADRDQYRQIALQSVGLLEKPGAVPSPRPSPSPSPGSSKLGFNFPSPVPYATPLPQIQNQVLEIRDKLNRLEAKSPKLNTPPPG
jgi:hypothetical protein